jgi:hypothetical protein
MQRHHDAVVEQQFLRVCEIDIGADDVGDVTRERGRAGNRAARNLDEMLTRSSLFR